MLKKIILSAVALLMLATIVSFIYINASVKVPEGTDAIVLEVLSQEVPELVNGKTGTATNGGVNIWYESRLPTDSIKGTILLVMGLGASAMIWDNTFCQPFLDAGYQVIRFDNRDAGLSTWLDNWEEDNPYTLGDMAKDGIAVLDALGIKKAHIVGASMGGMIGQRMAISHADRVASFTSIMSSGYVLDPTIPPATAGIRQEYIKLGLKYLLHDTEENTLKFNIGKKSLLKGSGAYDINLKNSAQITLYELRKRKGYNRQTVEHQIKAIEVSGSRLEELEKITCPTLIVHGIADPLISIEHARKYTPLIPQADTLFLAGMGHDFPSIHLKRIQEGILRNIKKAS